MSFPKNVPTATVHLDKPRTIALTLDALNRLEELTGQPLMEIGLDPAQIVKKLDAWIWSGLDDRDRAEISPAEIRQMIHLGNLTQMLSVVSSLVTASLPEVKTDPVPLETQRAEAGTTDLTYRSSGRLESTTSV